MAKTLKKFLVLGLVLCISAFVGIFAACNDGNTDKDGEEEKNPPANASTYTVTFDVQSHGTAPEAQTVNSGDHAQKPATDPSEKNWVFVGWYKEAAGTNEYVFSNETVTADTTIYAKWTAAPAVPAVESGMKHLYMSDSGEASIAENVWNYENKFLGTSQTYHYNLIEIGAGKAVTIMWHMGNDIEAGTQYKVDIRSTVEEDDFAQDPAMRAGLNMWIQDADVAAGQGSADYYWSEWNRTFGLIGLQIAFTEDQLDNISSPGGAMYKIILENTTDADVTLRIVCAVGDAH